VGAAKTPPVGKTSDVVGASAKRGGGAKDGRQLTAVSGNLGQKWGTAPGERH